MIYSGGSGELAVVAPCIPRLPDMPTTAIYSQRKNIFLMYLVHQDTYRCGNKMLDAHVKALASALAKSQSLETLLVPIGDFFPTYLKQFVNVQSLKSIHFICSQHLHRLDCYLSYYVDKIRHSVDRVPQLEALVTYTTLKYISPSTLLSLLF
jgi:hypothetical protein